jgi:hypothetical protein
MKSISRRSFLEATAASAALPSLRASAVCNNDGRRAGATVAAAERGLHVISDKPLALADTYRVNEITLATHEASLAHKILTL